ncbi:hypothetical protein Tco_0807242 [Tanacetum coccineum]
MKETKSAMHELKRSNCDSSASPLGGRRTEKAKEILLTRSLGFSIRCLQQSSPTTSIRIVATSSPTLTPFDEKQIFYSLWEADAFIAIVDEQVSPGFQMLRTYDPVGGHFILEALSTMIHYHQPRRLSPIFKDLKVVETQSSSLNMILLMNKS